MPDAEQRLVAVRAVHGLLTEETREERSMSLAYLLDVLAEVYDDPEQPFFGGLAAEFEVPQPRETHLRGTVQHRGSADGCPQCRFLEGRPGEEEAVAACGYSFRHAAHGDCDGIPRRKKVRREDLPLERDDGSTFTPGQHLSPRQRPSS